MQVVLHAYATKNSVGEAFLAQNKNLKMRALEPEIIKKIIF
jgi:hypothetical protein